MKHFGWGLFLLIGILFIIILPTIKTCNIAGKLIDNGINTAYQEFKPEELLRKYEWFKEASAQCEQKLATLKTYESRFEVLKRAYGPDSLNRRNWERADLEQWNVWQSEYLGVKASYNDLASQYNSAMAKFNYRFVNVGELPKGAVGTVPREFRPYLND